MAVEEVGRVRELYRVRATCAVEDVAVAVGALVEGGGVMSSSPEDIQHQRDFNEAKRWLDENRDAIRDFVDEKMLKRQDDWRRSISKALGQRDDTRGRLR